ncbi:MAG: hypothetical protein ACRDS0_05785 [Pseudonocardiaceae bacterium]
MIELRASRRMMAAATVVYDLVSDVTRMGETLRRLAETAEAAAWAGRP